MFWANVIEADADATLNSFGAYAFLAPGCGINFYLLSASSYDTTSYFEDTTWTVVWKQDSANSTYGTNTYESEDVGLILESGTFYALGYESQGCSSDDVIAYLGENEASSDVGIGQTQGYLVEIDWEYGDEVDEGDEIVVPSTGPSYFGYAPVNMTLNATEL
jgi:hypothetical protein